MPRPAQAGRGLFSAGIVQQLWQYRQGPKPQRCNVLSAFPVLDMWKFRRASENRFSRRAGPRTNPTPKAASVAVLLQLLLRNDCRKSIAAVPRCCTKIMELTLRRLLSRFVSPSMKFPAAQRLQECTVQPLQIAKSKVFLPPPKGELT
jgi:hypothetical protein